VRCPFPGSFSLSLLVAMLLLLCFLNQIEFMVAMYKY
jgi:hypothetical protein